MKEKIFGVLQRIGRSFMLPIALLPVAGLFLGIGGSFTNETMLSAYGLTGIMGPGTFLYSILTVMCAAGNVVFANLPILFAMGVAIGMAKREKEVAALAGAVAFFIMHASIGALITIKGGEEAFLSGATASVLGITSLQMGVFGGIIVGLGVAGLHNKFYKIELPQVLSFFGGTRFVPIISAVVYLFVGIAMFYIWPFIQSGIFALGALVKGSGYAGTFIYGIIERALIPFGLHHIFYLPFWQTSVGGTAVIDGVTWEGAQNIFFAELGSKSITHFSVDATRFMTGKFPFMIFGLPGAALAMYRNARPEKKKVVGGLLLSAALTAMLTGITEPIEFTFLFVAPALYAIHCVFAGLSFMLMHLLQVTVGMTFSGGFIDLFLFGILQGNGKTNWMLIVPVGICYFVVYYFLFSFLIKKFSLKTPGREEDDEETKLYTRDDYNAKKSGNDQAKAIADALGGKANIVDVDCCATRLRITVKEPERVLEGVLKSTGAHGVVKHGKGIQVIYGPKVNIVKAELEDYLAKAPNEFSNVSEVADTSSTASDSKSTQGKLLKTIVIASPVSGTAVKIEDIPDKGFSERMMGDGMGVEPSNGTFVAPADGTISFAFPSKHAVGLDLGGGVQLLLHIGIDTVNLNGEGFELFVKEGDTVKKGDKLIQVDLSIVKSKVPSMISPVLITDMENNQIIDPIASGNVKAGDDLFSLNIYE